MCAEMVDGLAWVKNSASIFFPNSPPSDMALLAYIMSDILESGGGSCLIRRVGGCWFAGSDKNWMDIDGYSTVDLFRNVIAEPGRGEFAIRSEILIYAFSEKVSVGIDGCIYDVKGGLECDSCAGMGMKYFICFQGL